MHHETDWYFQGLATAIQLGDRIGFRVATRDMSPQGSRGWGFGPEKLLSHFSPATAGLVTISVNNQLFESIVLHATCVGVGPGLN